jgi:hypothetical protein
LTGQYLIYAEKILYKYIKTIKEAIMKKKLGRPKQEIKRNVEVKFLVTEEENAKIEALAEKIGVNKSRLIRNLVLGDLTETNMLYHLGAIPIAKAILRFTHSLRGENFDEIIKKED